MVDELRSPLRTLTTAGLIVVVGHTNGTGSPSVVRNQGSPGATHQFLAHVPLLDPPIPGHVSRVYYQRSLVRPELHSLRIQPNPCLCETTYINDPHVYRTPTRDTRKQRR